MADDARLAELRGLMAEALRQHRWTREESPVPSAEEAYRPGAPCMDCGTYPGLIHQRSDCVRALADALLPVVSAWAEQDREQHAARRAAEELRAIVLDAQIVGEVMHERGPIRVPITYLSERAAALTPAPEEKR